MLTNLGGYKRCPYEATKIFNFMECLIVNQKSYMIYKFQKFLKVQKITTSKIVELRKTSFKFFKVFYILNTTLTFLIAEGFS